VKLALTTTSSACFLSNPTTAQVSSAKKAARVAITKGPVPELISDYVTFIRWITTKTLAGGRSLGLVHYGTDPRT